MVKNTSANFATPSLPHLRLAKGYSEAEKAGRDRGARMSLCIDNNIRLTQNIKESSEKSEEPDFSRGDDSQIESKGGFH